ncbi:peroxidasin homolog [Folsomia candida]|uniref:Peroxidasin n=1 Tax=Folsomia candida TaxID=158441 RepID=A0A226EHM9_FOLCA|nr:peroxidasin homolog [Folsomia candida]OXA57165.1 Peroxidasin [Folsomia candida]
MRILIYLFIWTAQLVSSQPYDVKSSENLLESLAKFPTQDFYANDLSTDDFLGQRPLARNRTEGRRSARFTSLTTAIGDQSSNNLRDYDRLVSLGLPKSWVLGILRTRRHPSCYRTVYACFPNNKYRTIDGTCNNYLHPVWGSSYNTFQRLFPAQYSDGYNSPKGLPPQRPLPNARLVSSTIHSDLIHPDSTLTNMVPQIGQFLDHDFALTIDDDRRCCTTEEGHRDCFSISIPTNDYFYSNLSTPQTCMDFTRSTPFCFPTESGVREQFNIDTSYIDASQVYGSENKRSQHLRQFSGGRLAMSSENGRLLPPVKQVEEKYKTQIEFMGKFLGGDERVNEMPALTVMHTLWVLEHNRIAGLIAKFKPDWIDEVIFQETRRIVIAEWQTVIYGQFLTTVLGNATMEKYKLGLGSGSEKGFTEYNPNLDATLFHHFATAAYRFGHTLLNGLIRLVRGLTEVGSYFVRDNYFDSAQIERNGSLGYELILGGLMTQNAQTHDRFVSVDFTNFLLKEKHMNFGADLIARNIQRSRDHAIPNYGVYRTHCGLGPLSNDWRRRPPEFSEETWQKFKSVYSSPRDIELFPGGLSELPLNGAVSGPTFNCLKAKQFKMLKYGDRFFFTHRNQAGSFTARQIQSIRRRTLGDVICENSDIERTTVNVFNIASDSNPWVDCTDSRRTKIRIADFV